MKFLQKTETMFKVHERKILIFNLECMQRNSSKN